MRCPSGSLRCPSGSLRRPVRYLRRPVRYLRGGAAIRDVVPAKAANCAENFRPKRGAPSAFPPRSVLIGAHVSADGAKRGTNCSARHGVGHF